MSKPLSILLVEDEPLECQKIIEYVDITHDVQLVGVTNNTTQALEYVIDMRPDAIILDLELHKGYGNGLAFLESLKEIRKRLPTYVLVTTNNISYTTHDSARMLGADFIMLKIQEDYSAKSVIDFLRSLKRIIHSKTTAHVVNEESPNQREQRITNRIITEIDYVGIAPNAIGRKYLISAIMLVINGQTEKISTKISEKYEKTEPSVERAMQNAIERAWKTADINDLEKHYTARIRSARGVPTIMEFIFHYAEKIKRDYF
ncbi:MAG: response regulator [Defluviitaleaceae bacterium]|nr:response regulator [Defluviitaleaceae bacterium]